jgi:hypothetical protein
VGVSLSASAAAQSPVAIAGRVLDATSREPLEQVEVRVESQLTMTSRDGSFRVDGLAPGRLELCFRRIGYAPACEAVEALPGTELRLDRTLVPRAVLLDSLTVTATRGTAELTGSELERRGRTLAQALDGWEGVQLRPGPDGSASPTIRGSAADEVLVLLDGFPVNDPYSGRADLGRVSSGAIRGVTLWSGAEGARFGHRAVAGVIVIETRSEAGSEFSAEAGSHRVYAGRFRTGIGAARISGEVRTLADHYSYIQPAVRGGGTAERANAGGALWSLAARRSGTLDLQLRGTASTRGLPGPVTNPTAAARAADLTLFAGLRSSGHWRVAASAEFLSSRFNDPRPPTGLAYRWSSRGTSGSLRVEHGVTAVHGFTASAAVESRYDRFSGSAVPSGAGQGQVAALLDGGWEPARHWMVTPTLRLDWWSGRRTPRVSGRLGTSLALGRTTVSAALGSSVTAPVPANLFFREGTGVIVNPDLRPERVRWEVELGVRQGYVLAGLDGDFSLRGFWGRVDDLILWGQSPAAHFAWMPLNFDALRRGGEVSLSLRSARGFSLGAGGSLSRITRPWNGAAQLAYRPVVSLSASGSWVRGRFSADLRWHFLGTRYRDNSGVNQLPAFGVLGAGVQLDLSPVTRIRLDADDLADRQPSYISGYPAPGRLVTATLTYRTP